MNSISLILGFITGIIFGLILIGKEGRKEIKDNLFKKNGEGK